MYNSTPLYGNKPAPAIFHVLRAPTGVYDQLTKPQSGIEWHSSRGWKFCISRVIKKKWAFYLNVNPVKKFFESPNFLATQFVRLVLAGFKQK